ncbi:branched-chain amino acid ABC transporter permease [Bradyrhizobium sp. U87765 SZCCT0131]|uniref:branched-chain amino acid ABC transporter permease n=1 Tax=unclassified Bradyrhizobium TaxID=2631580 RepID=UPI001BA8E2EF|nr:MULTISPECIES: branched-chain amino acid ABC transporter permease [unclassified Bradyrhizobium]MBR1217738.1 branched-chain amino acid ABC transporter permease [Bradyrhizobium sp. U87765 SZCCT0131]MBR1261316.1 branched-chain amino acid ABC transporter permease [Bradyrhizobium sp. U87765 SZCCT0134]MBR1303236.1 branched-chain amino acid ABC transporter permease [Bradyrhizobium sp. U87765 SZCCT0110]MBR1318842.1 branched-chain amino acid ABC transporter permease [Bradyrhizobium sp. U87765 SZCCT010
MTAYLVATLTVVAIATLAGLALNLQWGLGGLVNFGLFGFYMLGAYIAALLTVQGVPPLLALAAAMAGVAAVSAASSLISVRLSEDYLAIVTLGFAECLRLVISYEGWLTRGMLGVTGIARPFQELWPRDLADTGFLAIALLAVVAVYVILEVLARSPFGRLVRATRDDPGVVEALGKSVLGVRVRVFAVGGAILGLAGSLHAFYYTYIDPTQFGPIITAYAFMVVVIGGRGSNRGVLVSAFTLVFLLEGSRFLIDYIPGLGASDLAAIRLCLVGVGLVALLIFKPDGFGREPRSVLADQTSPRV